MVLLLIKNMYTFAFDSDSYNDKLNCDFKKLKFIKRRTSVKFNLIERQKNMTSLFTLKKCKFILIK
jgi:hypothetical protein